MSSHLNPPNASKPSKYHNYLTLSNNCKAITNGAKPLHHNNPQNILTDNMRQLWLSKELPAVCIIDLRGMIQKPICWNRIGFMCWHEYDSNPKLVQVEYTGQDNPESAVWVVWAKIRLELTSNWQHFKLPITSVKNLSFLKLKIMQNHSQPIDQHVDQDQPQQQTGTYLNQVSLGFVEQIIQSRVQLTVASQLRQKTFSDYRKIGNNDNRQLKRLSERVKQLSSDNEVMRKTIDHQNTIIIKLQEAIQTLVGNVGKLQEKQKGQEKRLKVLEKERQNQKERGVRSNSNYNNSRMDNNSLSKQKHNNKKQHIQQFFNDQSQISYHQQLTKPHHNHLSHQRSRSPHTSTYQQPSHLSRTNKQSVHNRSNKNKSSHHKSNHSNKRQVINANINQSDESMSEYQGVVDERTYSRKRVQGNGKVKEGVYIPMLQKLQQLIMLRDEKKNKLKTHKKPKKSNIILSSSESSNDSES